MLYKFSRRGGLGEHAHSSDQSGSDWLRGQTGFAPALPPQARMGVRRLPRAQVVPGRSRGLPWLSHSQCVCVCARAFAHVSTSTCVPSQLCLILCPPEMGWLLCEHWGVEILPWEGPALTLRECSRCRVRGLAPSATTQIRPQVAVVRQ